MSETKQCSMCGEEKPLMEFPRRSRNKKDGRGYLCLVCDRKRNYEWRHSEHGRRMLDNYKPRANAKRRDRLSSDELAGYRVAVKNAIWRLDNVTPSDNKPMGNINKLLGYTSRELQDHFSQFYGKPCVCGCGTILTKENSSTDHIIPMVTANTKDEIIKLSALSNLHRICRLGNSRKGTSFISTLRLEQGYQECRKALPHEEQNPSSLEETVLQRMAV